MDVTPLSGGAGQDLGEGLLESRMVVGDHELDAVQAPLPEAHQEVFPARGALARGHVHRQDFQTAARVDADRDQDRLGTDHAAFAHLLVTGIEDEVGVGFVEASFGKLRECGIETVVDRTDAGRGKLVATELLGDRLDLAGGDPCPYISARAATNAFSERCLELFRLT